MLDGVQARLLLQVVGLVIVGLLGPWTATFLVQLAQYGLLLATAELSWSQIPFPSVAGWVASISEIVAFLAMLVIGVRLFFGSGWLFGFLVRSLTT